MQDARRDPNPDVRHAARAALARLGERQALQWFRQTLTSEDPQRIHEAIQAVAVEGLTLLWPDLDRLADAEDPDVAQHAREALERMCEEMDFGAPGAKIQTFTLVLPLCCALCVLCGENGLRPPRFPSRPPRTPADSSDTR